MSRVKIDIRITPRGNKTLTRKPDAHAETRRLGSAIKRPYSHALTFSFVAEGDTTGGTMSFRRLCALRVFTSNEAALNFCEGWAIVKKRSTCACGKEMRKQRAKTVDGWRWQCSACKNTTSLRSGSFWAHSRIEMHQLLALTFFWACQLEGEMIATHTGLSERTVTSWSQRFQVFCSQAVE